MAKAPSKKPVASAKDPSKPPRLHVASMAGRRQSTGPKVGSAAQPVLTARKGPRLSPAPAAAVPLDNKKGSKNAAGFKRHDLEYFRNLLLEKRRELVGDMGQMETEALQRGGNSNLSNLPIHMADMGTDNYEQEFTLGLVETDRTLVQEITRALIRIQDGTFGICEGTGKPISRARLEAQPWARFTIEYARKVERRTGH